MRPKRPTPARPPRVALLVEASNAYGRGVLSGVADYVQKHGHWSVYLPETGRAEPLARRLRDWHGDGVLMRAEDGAGRGAVRVGYLAAELLGELMSGRAVDGGVRLMPPLDVTARRSTDALAVADADVALALRFIRDHCCRPIGVEDVLGRLPLSRRSLEGKFLRLVGRTPHAEIVRCRVERARHLLANTDLPVKAVAAKVGVGTPEYLSVLLRRTLGTTPSAIRAKTE